MSHRKYRAMITVFMVLVLIGGGAVWGAETLEKLWQKVNKAQQNGLPKSAVTHLKKIVQLAMEREE